MDFFRRGRKQVTIAHFDHGTQHGRGARNLVLEWAEEECIELVESRSSGKKPSGRSWEDWWRQKRYEFLHSLPGTVVTAHNLDDAVEWWIMSSLHGTGRLIPIRKENVIRPFLTTPKLSLHRWCDSRDVPYSNDPANSDERHTRSIVRHRLLPQALRVNPGLYKTVRKKLRPPA
jgi:tRNA(Ile)-lysidine synthase